MDEQREFMKRHLQDLREREEAELLNEVETIKAFKDHMVTLNILLDDSNFSFIQPIGIVADYPDILTHLDSQLTPDKDGLFDFRQLLATFQRRFRSGSLTGSNFIVLADPHFRRGMHPDANFAPAFLDNLWKENDPAIKYSLSLDRNRVRINMDNSDYAEFDTWYGPAFDKKIENIPNEISQLRPPMNLSKSEIKFFFDSTYVVDVKWATDHKNVRIFHLEEFKSEDITVNIDGEIFHPARYVHSEYEAGSGYFRHFDGAVHFYEPEEYYARRDVGLNFNNKSSNQIKSRSRKLFKMDGKVPLGTWIQYISHFCTGNPLIHEYFEGHYPEHITRLLNSLGNQNNV